MEENDRDDWQGFLLGDQRGLERIYERHRNAMYTYCLYVSGDRQLSEDITQETFMRLMEQKQKLQIENSLKGWLFICTRNLLFNRLKQQKVRSDRAKEFAEAVGVLDVETKLFIESVLGRLTADERELVILREQQRFTIAEIAQILGISEEAVRVRLFRARKRMQQIAKDGK
jgi:RNA polymerase sigma factor (sigma-70 family)